MQPNHSESTGTDFFLLNEDTSGLYPFFNQHQLQQQQQHHHHHQPQHAHHQQIQHPHPLIDFSAPTTATPTTSTVTTSTSNSSSTVMQYATAENFVINDNEAILNNPPSFITSQQQQQNPPSIPTQQQQQQQPQQQPQQQQQQQTTQTRNQSSSGVDFRRRRNWSERILNEVTGLLHVLSPVGKILHCSPSCIELTGYAPEELIGRSLTEYLHVDDIDIFIRDFNRAFHTRSQIKTIYRFRKKDQSYTLFETIGHPRTDVPGQPPRSFFAIAQPYPSAMNSLFDSFLELKMENEWLKQRLREIPIEVPGIEPLFPPDLMEDTTTMANNNNNNNDNNTITTNQHLQQRGYDNNTKNYLKKRPSASEETSLSNHSNTTTSNNMSNNNTENGLWLQENAIMTMYGNNNNTSNNNNNNNNTSRDRSPVPPTTASPSAQGVAVAGVGMASVNVMDITETTTGEIIKDKSKRRKKQRGADEYVCTDCGTATSPEWRKGPHGPKTLCNACGLRWAKKSKKKGLSTD